MVAKSYLIIVGLLYLGLAVWCTCAPLVTSNKVGFELKGGSGQSEFMTVYGGLELGLALILLLAAFRTSMLEFGLLSCVILHAALVVFRSASLFRFSDFEGMTYRLAIGEWVILLTGLAILLTRSSTE